MMWHSVGQQLHNLLRVVPELKQFAHLDLRVAYNKDSCRVGPKEWVMLAKMLDANRYCCPHNLRSRCAV